MITAPPAGAGPDSVTLPAALAPPVTVAGFSVSDARVGGGGRPQPRPGDIVSELLCRVTS